MPYMPYIVNQQPVYRSDVRRVLKKNLIRLLQKKENDKQSSGIRIESEGLSFSAFPVLTNNTLTETKLGSFDDCILTQDMMDEMEADAFGQSDTPVVPKTGDANSASVKSSTVVTTIKKIQTSKKRSSKLCTRGSVNSNQKLKKVYIRNKRKRINIRRENTSKVQKLVHKRTKIFGNSSIQYKNQLDSMVKEIGKDRFDHRGDRSDRLTASSGRLGRDREGSTSSSRDRDRPQRDEPTSTKRLRNEGEPRLGSNISKSEQNPTSIPVSSSSSKSSSTTLPSSSPVSSTMGSNRNSSEDTYVSLNKKELYESVVDYENNEAKRLETAEGVKECHTACEELKDNFLAIMDKKNSEEEEDEEELEETMENGLMKLMSLRRLNRIMKLKLKSVKEDQLSMRNEVDSDHLLLQNLLYEATHLQNQVAAVQDYKGMDENIDLIPVTQFYEEAPLKISKPEVTKNDSHLLRIARLEYEFLQRQKLTEDCNFLEKEKEETSKSIEEKQAKLDSIQPLLSNVLETTKPIQDFFGIDVSSKKERNQIALYLPSELYVLFVQSNAFKDAKDGKENFMVHICGSVEASKELVLTPDEVEEDSDSDKEQDPDVEISERRLLRKKSSIYLTPEDNKKKLLQKHPLWIEWIVKAGSGDAILIQFFYLVKLKIVTVKAKVQTGINENDVNKPSAEEMTSIDNLLTDLFPDDNGLESPNPANVFMFQKVDANGISEFLNETGRPFKWAQRLAGIEFSTLLTSTRHEGEINDEKNLLIQPSMQIRAISIEKTLKLIRKRLTNQTKLWNQLKALESKNIQIPVAAKDLFHSKTSTIFKSWESMNYSQYISFEFTRDHLRTESVSEKHMFYKATLERGRATIIALVALCLDFPSVPPVFCVQLEQDGERRNATNDSAVRDLEKEVNVHSPKEFEEWSEILVSLQLQMLMQCTDIILETDFPLGESVGPSEFGRDKLFLRAAAGRNLRRPFKYFGTGGGYFSQRF